ncbi:MAG TPA: AbrB/MazE/SpoVT family DNA-binding domain-containing protein [Chloroflexota bacterium]|jgi:antitoxin MazE
MRTHIVQIGNSRGLRIPKAFLEECGIRDVVELSVENGRLIVESSHPVREGWAEAAHTMAGRKEDHLIDPHIPTEFDEAEWEW